MRAINPTSRLLPTPTLAFAALAALLTVGCAATQGPGASVQDALNQCNQDYRALNIEHQNLTKALQGRAAALAIRPPNALGAPEVVTSKLNSADLEGMLQHFGFGFDRIKPDAYMFTLSQTRVILFNKGTSLQLYAGFHAKPSLIKVNEWNQMTRFSRAYLDQEGDAIIEFDLDLESGWTREGIQEFIRTFGLVVEAYRMFLSAPDAQPRTVSL